MSQRRFCFLKVNPLSLELVNFEPKQMSDFKLEFNRFQNLGIEKINNLTEIHRALIFFFFNLIIWNQLDLQVIGRYVVTLCNKKPIQIGLRLGVDFLSLMSQEAEKEGKQQVEGTWTHQQNLEEWSVQQVSNYAHINHQNKDPLTILISSFVLATIVLVIIITTPDRPPKNKMAGEEL